MEIRIRSYKPSDAKIIDEIYERCGYSFNHPDISKCLRMAVIECNGKIIALGAFQLAPELILILDNQVSKKAQVEALKQLMTASDFTMSLEGFNAVYASPDSEKFSKILEKHFGFVERDKMLIKTLDDGVKENE